MVVYTGKGNSMLLTSSKFTSIFHGYIGIFVKFCVLYIVGYNALCIVRMFICMGTDIVGMKVLDIYYT